MEFDKVNDSGTRREFGTGAVRDAAQNKGRFDLLPFYPLWRLARHYENGAVKYGDSNWKKGIPVKTYLDSMMRHAAKATDHMTDEDHLAAVAWNAFGAMWTIKQIEDRKLPFNLAEGYESILNMCETPELPDTKSASLSTQTTEPDLNAPTPPKKGWPVNPCAQCAADAIGCLGTGRPRENSELRQTRIYLSHPIRGTKQGLEGGALKEYVKGNNDWARKVADIIRELTPDIDLYVPAEHEEFVQLAYDKNLLTVDQILLIDTAIIDKCDAVLAVTPESCFSNGMLVEMSYCDVANLPCMASHDMPVDPNALRDRLTWLTNNLLRCFGD